VPVILLVRARLTPLKKTAYGIDAPSYSGRRNKGLLGRETGGTPNSSRSLVSIRTWDGSIVAEVATACGFRTVRVGKRSSAQNALTANRATALLNDRFTHAAVDRNLLGIYYRPQRPWRASQPTRRAKNFAGSFFRTDVIVPLRSSIPGQHS